MASTIVTARPPQPSNPDPTAALGTEIAPVPAPAPIESKDVDSVGSAGVDAPPQPKSPPPTQSRALPPVSQKPTSNSFRDRIAAFNKPAAPPIAPFKPSGLGSGSSSFIKKPFVAPPPSRHAYVPPPRDAPVTRIYRREEDPEIKEKHAESIDAAEKARPMAVIDPDPQDEDQPKPTTLKERIALLQKQQAEAAQRLAGAIAKKEKPGRPPKKRIDINTPQETTTMDQTMAPPLPLDRKDSADISRKDSVDEPHSARQSLNISRTSTDPIEIHESTTDMQGAGDTTEGQADFTAHDGGDEKIKAPVSGEGSTPEEQVTGEDAEEEQDEEDDVDPEVRRKEELRARMAKMSGGMGMAGMFGPPGMMGLGGLPVKKPKPPIPVERRPSGIAEGPSSPRMTAPPIPMMMALPGMGKLRQPEEVPEPEPAQERAEEEEEAPTSIGDGTSSEPESSQTTGAPPRVPGGRPAPPPVPTDSRPPIPPPPPAALISPSIGSESDDEIPNSIASPPNVASLFER
ncbi:hypothetical protein ONZ43_g3457 [Nemania bipapillata]|uniref:Uncharacterized protein n=1 Tax=Nemania bipapillata TaxID=110536 RepID=A0ACC2IX76_9PEZI|nr:hypothetical protein ONZ43_g3457 [Nemania bipapillata]